MFAAVMIVWRPQNTENQYEIKPVYRNLGKDPGKNTHNIYKYIHMHTHIYIYISLSEINLPYPFMVDFWTMAPDSTVRPQLCTSSWCIAPILRPPLGSAVDGFKSPWRQRNIHWKRRYYIYTHIYTGCWFQTFFVFHNIWDNPSHWLIVFKMVKTTNQCMYICV